MEVFLFFLRQSHSPQIFLDAVTKSTLLCLCHTHLRLSRANVFFYLFLSISLYSTTSNEKTRSLCYVYLYDTIRYDTISSMYVQIDKIKGETRVARWPMQPINIEPMKMLIHRNNRRWPPMSKCINV